MRASRSALKTCILVCLIVVATLVFAKDRPITKDRVEISTQYGSVILSNVSLDGKKMFGTVNNNTDRAWRVLSFAVKLMDKSGRRLNLEAPLFTVSVKDLQKGQSKPLADILHDGFADFSIIWNRSWKVADFDLALVPQFSAYDARYVFRLLKPTESDILMFEDDTIKIVLIPDVKQLGFTLLNKTNEPITLEWDRISQIDLSGTAHRVMHQGTRIADRDKPQAATVIPPQSKIDDFVYPSDYVTWSSTTSRWDDGRPILPLQDQLQQKGQTFGLFMPLEINGQKKNYMFTIKIADVMI